MLNSFYLLSFFLICSIVLIVVLTTRFKIHPFFALVLAALMVGIGAGIAPLDVITVMQDGFGRMMKSLGFIIILGTTLGISLEHSGSTKVIANVILKIAGAKRSTFAMSVTGLVVGLPIFCDSGFIVLSGLISPLSKRTGTKVVTLAGSLATGLYAVHCLIPPHPGASAAAGIISVDFGKLILFGIIVAIPAMIAGYLWIIFKDKKEIQATQHEENPHLSKSEFSPSAFQAFLPVAIPILLIALKSFLLGNRISVNIFETILSFAGETVVALSIGLLLAFCNSSIWKNKLASELLKEGAEKAGGILIIIGAGGAFGAVLAATKIGEQFSGVLPLQSMGILFPFLLTFILKTAQGSSTVAIITAASIVLPLLNELGLDSENGRLLCVLSMGAGSMMISHANDAYFWVISNFSKIGIQSMLKVYSVATVWMGVVSMLMIYILSLLLN